MVQYLGITLGYTTPMAYTTNPRLPRVRMEAVRLVKYRGWSTRRVARYTGYSQSVIVKWCSRDTGGGWRRIPTISSRPHHHPGELKQEMVDAIIEQRKKRGRCAEVVHQELQNKGVAVSLSSVKRTLDRCGLTKKRSPWKRYHAPMERPYVAYPGNLVEVDTIHIGPHRPGRLYIYTLLDVYSRWAWADVVLRINTHYSLRFVGAAQSKALFAFRTIQSDHGQEFSTWFTENIQVKGLTHRHSRVRQPNDNAHLERFNRTIQEECLNRIPETLKAYQKEIPEYLHYYNNERLHLGLNLKTPQQVIPRY